METAEFKVIFGHSISDVESATVHVPLFSDGCENDLDRLNKMAIELAVKELHGPDAGWLPDDEIHDHGWITYPPDTEIGLYRPRVIRVSAGAIKPVPPPSPPLTEGKHVSYKPMAGGDDIPPPPPAPKPSTLTDGICPECKKSMLDCMKKRNYPWLCSGLFGIVSADIYVYDAAASEARAADDAAAAAVDAERRRQFDCLKQSPLIDKLNLMIQQMKNDLTVMLPSPKPYLLFSGSDYYPMGGAADLKGCYETLNEAVSHAHDADDWVHVLCLTSMQVVIRYKNNLWSDPFPYYDII